MPGLRLRIEEVIVLHRLALFFGSGEVRALDMLSMIQQESAQVDCSQF
jgi:hypothetical protein